MARMYPNQLDPNTKSDAERQLYQAFCDELDDDYTVFHSVAWQSLDGEGRPRDGEADFIIAHPKRGILVLEVKGGSICCDPETGHWTSTDRWGQSHPIKDPFAQARSGKYALQDKVQVLLNKPKHHINVGHAVAFPEVVTDDVLPGLDKPRQIILDTTDLANLSIWVGQALAYWRGPKTQRETQPGKKAVTALMNTLGKAWELRPALWGSFVQEQQQLIRLTEQQYLILDMLNRQRRAAISGCAGSGKTMLAAEKAKRLAQQGFRVLLTCFNKNLARDLHARLKPSTQLDILHFHKLCFELCKQAQVLPIEDDDKALFFGQKLPEALLEATDVLETRYDAIIVDEGQDFQENWWFPLQMLLRDPDNGILYIFFDDNQRIYVQHGEFPIKQPPYLLTVNCRNTQLIHRTVMQFYDAEIRPTALGPRGRQVATATYEAPKDLWFILHTILQQLTDKEKVPAEEIAVLTPVSRVKRNLLNKSTNSRPQLVDTLPPGEGQVYCTTIHDFKGLERATIILAGIGRWTEDLNSLLYVGCSRARNQLIALLPEKASPKLRRIFETK